MRRRLAVLCLLAACSTSAGPTPAGPPSDGTAPAQQAPQAAVASVVILETKECCACTDKRQKDARAAFDAELARLPVKPPVTVIFVDTQPDEARPWRDLQEPVVTPAYYLLDGAGLLVTFLQGEVTGPQFAQVLGTP